jgi:hypothetical protein
MIMGDTWNEHRTLIRKHLEGTRGVKLSPLTGHESLYGCEMLRIPHCLDSRLIDGVRLSALSTGRALLPKNIFLLLVLISVRG